MKDRIQQENTDVSITTRLNPVWPTFKETGGLSEGFDKAGSACEIKHVYLDHKRSLFKKAFIVLIL